MTSEKFMGGYALMDPTPREMLPSVTGGHQCFMTFELFQNYKEIKVFCCHLEHNNNVYAFFVNGNWHYRTIWQDVKIKINYELKKAEEFKEVKQ